jgi:ferredoxin
VPYGSNLRDELISRGVSVYQSVTRWTNCNGKQLCGTCIVDVVHGIDGCTRRSVDEASTLRENPETYKLACITNLYGDVTVRVKPKIGAAQWTR